MELVHVLSQQCSKARENLLVPRVVLERHLLLDFAVVDLNGSKGLHSVRGVYGLTRFPVGRQRQLLECIHGIKTDREIQNLFEIDLRVPVHIILSRGVV